jgi:HTH-type transcriptional regulator/antitoxin HigA
MSNTKDERELLSKPGDTILETLEEIRMTQSELAKRMGKTPSKINDLIAGKEPITTTTAFQLEKVLGIDVQFWLNREALYREKLTRLEQEEALEECIDWLKQQPVKQLKETGFVKSNKVGPAMVDELLKFYAVDSPKEWETVYVHDCDSVSFRSSKAYTTALTSLTAWLRLGEIAMRRIELPEYNKEDFKNSLNEILKLVEIHPEDFAEQLQEIVRVVGVALVYTPGFPHAPLSGAARWVGGNPLIQLTDRYKFNDQFWFTFFHEAGHILLHGKKNVFIEEFDTTLTDEEKEREANDFAAEWLLPESFSKDLPAGPITERDIRIIARRYKTHPAVVLGRLQRLKKVEHYFGSGLKMKVDLTYHIKNQFQ